MCTCCSNRTATLAPPLFTEVLKDDFACAFDAADAVTFMDVYPAGEAPVPGVSGKTFLNVVLDHPGHPEAAYVPRRIEVVPHLVSALHAGDLLVTMGAGDVTAIGPQLLDALLRAPRRLRTRNPPTRSDAEMTARHTSELEALLVDDAFDGDVYPNEPMSRHTMYRIGGPARFYVQVGSVGALKRLVETCERTGVPWTAVGRGSNLLVADEGYPGVVVTLGARFPHLPFRRGDEALLRGSGRAAVIGGAGGVSALARGPRVRRGHSGHRGRGALRMNAGTREGVDRRAGGVGDHALSGRGACAARGRRARMGISADLPFVRTR